MHNLALLTMLQPSVVGCSLSSANTKTMLTVQQAVQRGLKAAGLHSTEFSNSVQQHKLRTSGKYQCTDAAQYLQCKHAALAKSMW